MALNTNLTGGAQVSPTMQTYYDKKLLINAKPKLIHHEYGQKAVLPKNSGKSIQFRKWTPFDALTTPLQEGVVPNGQALKMTAVTAEISQYGGYVAVSDLLDLTALDPVINDSVELMGDQGGLSVDTLVSDELATVPNVQYAEGKTARSQLDESAANGCRLTVNEIRKAVRTLKKNRAPQFVRGGKSHYIAIVGPETTYDLQSDALWQDVAKYSASEQIFDGEIGKLFGVVFVETSQALIFGGEGLTTAYHSLTITSASGTSVMVNESMTSDDALQLQGRRIMINGLAYQIDLVNVSQKKMTLSSSLVGTVNAGDKVYTAEGSADGHPVGGTLVFGKNAYGVIDLEGGNMKSIVKPKGSAGTADPLDQISTIGWKVDGFAAKVLQPLWIVRIEHLFSE